MTARTEYNKFLTWLHARPGVSDDIKRVTNIIHEDFASVEPTVNGCRKVRKYGGKGISGSILN